MRISPALLSAALFCASTIPAPGQPLPALSARHFVRARGQATVSAQPDEARIEIGVTTQSQSAETAVAENALKSDAVLKELRGQFGPRTEVKTVSYSLTPMYEYPKAGGQPRLTGYTAQNTVRVTTGDISTVGRIIDLATRSGANHVDLLQFTLKNEQQFRAQALREAAAAARLNAEAIAAGLGLKPVRVIAAQENGPAEMEPIRQMALAPRAQIPAVQPPVEPGPIRIQAGVTVEVEVQ